MILCMAEEPTTTTLVPTWTPGDRLRKAREARSITVGEMAKRIKRSRNSITKYERQSTAHDLVLRAYAEETRVPIEWLRDGITPEKERRSAVTEVASVWNSRRHTDNSRFCQEFSRSRQAAA